MTRNFHDLGFAYDPSTVLYVPCYKYGAEMTRALDISPYGNHGIITGGAVPNPGGVLVATELVLNGGFETLGAGGADVFADWTEYTAPLGSISDDTVNVQTGAHSALLMADGINDNTTRLTQDIAVEPGKPYELSLWTRGAWSYAGRYHVYDNSNSAYIINLTSTGLSGGTYQQFKTRFTTPPGCTSVSIGLYAPAEDDMAPANFDSVSLKAVLPVSTPGMGWYFDGTDDVFDFGDTGVNNTFSWNTFTLFGWLNKTGRLTGARALIGRGYRGYLYVVSDMTATAQIRDGTSVNRTVSSANPVPYDKWACLAATYDNSYLRIFVNGVEAGTPVASAGGLASDTTKLGIGARGFSTIFIGLFDGLIGEVGALNRPLPPAEIRNYYETTRRRYGV